MNLEMPSPAETESLRKLLLAVLGVMIVTIPFVAVLVIAKLKARQREYPHKKKSEGILPENGGSAVGAEPSTTDLS